MTALLRKELMQGRLAFLALAAAIIALALAVRFGGRFMGEAAGSLQFYQYIIAPVFAALVPNQSLQYEEKNGNFRFLRCLPASPSAIVGAKYAVTCTVAAGVPVLFAVAGLVGASRGTIAGWTTDGGIALLLGGLVLFVGFLAGARAVMITLFSIVLGLNIAGMLALGTVGFGKVIHGLEVFLGTSAGAAAVFGGGVAVMLASYLASVWLFGRRDLTGMR